ncbi:MAG: hypothetical protein SWY16_25805 [Cyanobacteriota bacterium]|nr:hypothetical protein [Cyanobacteriota bacterium]
MDRREFLATMLIGSATAVAAAACGQNRQNWPTLEITPPASGDLTRLALISDATALALPDPSLPDSLRGALAGTAGLSSILGMGILFPTQSAIVSLLAKARPRWFDSSAEDNEHRVAIATGYLMHRAAERCIHKGFVEAGLNAAQENIAKLYQDAEVLRSFLVEVPQTVAEAESLLSVLDRRLRIKAHTIRPDGTDIKAWVLKFLAWDAAQATLFEKLASTIAEPNAEERSRYVESLNFFDRTSPLVNAARSQQAVNLTAENIEESSLYGRALLDCRRAISVVGQFIDGSIDASTLVETLDGQLAGVAG